MASGLTIDNFTNTDGLRSVSMVNANVGWTVEGGIYNAADKGVILHYKDGA